MKTRQELVVNLLNSALATAKVGILIKGIDGFSPIEVAESLTKDIEEHIYISAIGYDIIESSTQGYTLSNSVEKAVFWRSKPECAGSILVFVKTDTEKLHSLAEFDVLTMRDLTMYLIDMQLQKESNIPTVNFWKALRTDSDYLPFAMVEEYIKAVNFSDNRSEAIPQNMWKLNLLCDYDILGTKISPEERLQKNRELIIAIGQLSEESRKKLSRSLARAKADDKDRLQQAYRSLQLYFKYGKQETLRDLSFSVVHELFSASKATVEKKKAVSPNNGDDPIGEVSPNTPIKPKELNRLISDAVVTGSEEDRENIRELLSELKKHFDQNDTDNTDNIPTIGGAFGDRTIIVENHQTDLRRLVGRVCNEDSWGGLLETEESILKDAISADIVALNGFMPVNSDSILSFNGGIDGKTSLFDFIRRFDGLFESKGIQNVEPFTPIIEVLTKSRTELLSNLDLIMRFPVLTFGADKEIRQTLITYIDTWSRLYRAFCTNEAIMRQISPSGTSFVAKALLLLDILYVKTPTEWKGILLPLHPLYLWRYYEVFKTLSTKRGQLEEDDAKALIEVLDQLPQILSFMIASKLLTGTNDAVLPCSGNIEMLPTFENKTNRYLGDDGTQSIGEILTRWIGFAPYTKNEIRICTVDAPDLIGIIRSIKSFMDKNGCDKVICDVFLTRHQNGNTELSKLDYSGKDYEIGELIKQGKISISIHNVQSPVDVRAALDFRPVHIAFYFDQSSYLIEYGPNNQSLYINPLVVTYDYEFDEATHRGRIFPSSDVESGMIGDYHKLMRSADVISNSMNPRTTYNGNADTSAVVTTIQNNQTQWLVAADRDTNNYDPPHAIPIGEMQFEKRMVSVWASSNSRIISQYLTMLRGYNLYPERETLIRILKSFGHIASNGLISIPKFGADAQAIDNKKKGLLGTLFAAVWYTQNHDRSLVASLDDEKARLWLHDSKYGNERADLIGLRYVESTNTLYIQPIEVKTRDDSPDAIITVDNATGHHNISGHAAGQIASVVGMLKEIFGIVEADSLDMFISARREVLKYQIVSECFRNIHDPEWQKQWSAVLKRAFGQGKPENINIVVSGLLLYFKLSDASGGKVVQCVHPDFDDCPIEFRQMTTKEIQEHILGGTDSIEPTWTPDFDESEPPIAVGDDAIIDVDVDTNEREIESETQIVTGNETETNSDTETEARKTNYETTSTEKTEAQKVAEGPNTPKQLNELRSSSSSEEKVPVVSMEEIEQLAKDFKRSCGDYHINLRECDPKNSVVGPSVIRIKFKLARGQALQGLTNHLEDIGREMKRSGVIVQQVKNSDELLLDIPRLSREKVLFRDVIAKLPKITSPEQLYFPLGRTPNGRDLIKDLGQMPHMLVGGSTGSGKSVFLFTLLSSLLMTHPKKEDLQLILSSSKLEDFIHFEGLPHLYSGHVISDATEATRVIKEVIFEESERRGKLLAEARVANIIEYNKKAQEKLAPIVVVIDEFADLADQLESKKDQNAFYKPVQRIAQAGRSRGIHLIICTQRPEAKLVPSTTKAQLNGRVALRVNDGISSRMIIEAPDAQYLQKHGDMIYKYGDELERAQGYLIEIEELDEIVSSVTNNKY